MQTSAVATSARRTQVAAIALSVFALAQALRPLLFRFAAFRSFYDTHQWQAGETVWKVGWIALALLGVMIVHRVGMRTALREIGLGGIGAGRGLAFAFAAALPALLTFAVAFPLVRPIDLWQCAMTGIVSPVSEEVLFRGYLFRQLYARAGWPFWAALLINVVPFALGHLSQAERAGGELLTVAGVFVITGAGAALFAWLLVRSGYNLWFVIGLHAVLNLYWYVFAVSNTAIGGWLSNLARLTTLAFGVWLSRRLSRDGTASTQL